MIVIRILIYALFAVQIGLAQPVVKSTAPPSNIFSGTVTAYQPASIRVVRKLPARADEYRDFIVDKDTKIEGRLRVNARVTVSFKADSSGGVHALRIIVRADSKAAPGRAGTTP